MAEDGSQMAKRSALLAEQGDTYLPLLINALMPAAILSEGYVDVLGNVVCPLHRYKFDPCRMAGM